MDATDNTGKATTPMQTTDRPFGPDAASILATEQAEPESAAPRPRALPHPTRRTLSQCHEPDKRR